jgi:hypothetical protein
LQFVLTWRFCARRCLSQRCALALVAVRKG